MYHFLSSSQSLASLLISARITTLVKVGADILKKYYVSHGKVTSTWWHISAASSPSLFSADGNLAEQDTFHLGEIGWRGKRGSLGRMTGSSNTYRLSFRPIFCEPDGDMYLISRSPSVIFVCKISSPFLLICVLFCGPPAQLCLISLLYSVSLPPCPVLLTQSVPRFPNRFHY